jgi:hypothetical protein
MDGAKLTLGVAALGALAAGWSARGSRAGITDPMQDPFIRQHARGPRPALLVFAASTRGGRYRIEVYEDGVDTHGVYRPRGTQLYRAESFRSGDSAGSATGQERDQMIRWLRDTIEGSREIDGINYQVQLDELGVGLGEPR